jgi:hypothetical protein
MTILPQVGALELMTVLVFTSALLVLLGVYMSNKGYLNFATAALWTAICGVPILLGAARFMGLA